MRALVTGGTGFLGSYMTSYLAGEGVEVTATHLPRLAPPPGAAPRGVRIQPLDVTDRAQVTRLVEEVRPDVIYHFAGQAFVIPSWEDPAGTFATNLTGTLYLLEELRHHFPQTRFAFAGSGTEYGDPPHIPTSEESPLRPTSPYASSKAGADLLCYQYLRSFGVSVFRYRIYGTTGPGKRGDSTNDFASQIAQLERQPEPRVLRVGNLDKQRDIQDVRRGPGDGRRGGEGDARGGVQHRQRGPPQRPQESRDAAFVREGAHPGRDRAGTDAARR